MWKILAVVVVALVAADMYFTNSKYMNAFIQLVSEIGKSIGMR